MASGDPSAAAAPAVAPFGRKPLRTFALAIALPAFLLYVLSAMLVIGALAAMARDIDRLEDRRGLTAMHAALDDILSSLSDAVSDEGTWNEAYFNVVVNPDPAWMDTTWGATARIGLNYDSVLVTDQAGAILFGENNLGAIKGNIADHYSGAKTMLAALDTGIAATGDATSVSHFESDPTGPAAFAAISIHQSTPGEMAVPREQRRVLWIVKHITPAILQNIANRYQSPLASVVDAAEGDASAIVLTDADGRVAGTVAWTPDRPGEAAFDRAVVVAAGIFFIIGVGLVLGLGMLRRAMLKRARAIAAAQAAPDVAMPADDKSAGNRRAGDPRAAKTQAPPRLSDGVTPVNFELEYQPIFDVRAETLVGAEALLRWRKLDGTLVVQEALPPAERVALLDRVGILALRRACDEMAPLIGLSLLVELAPAQLENAVFAEKTIATLGATGFAARRLQLAADVALLPVPDLVRPALHNLRAAGIRFVLADFMLTAAAASYADAGLADGVRLAPALAADPATGAAQDRLVGATLETARTAGLAITVPGVDRKEMVARMVRLGCREFQGDLLARPMPVAALTQLALAPAVKQAS